MNWYEYQFIFTTILSPQPTHFQFCQLTLVASQLWICLVLHKTKKSESQSSNLNSRKSLYFNPFLHPIYQPLTSTRHSQRDPPLGTCPLRRRAGRCSRGLLSALRRAPWSRCRTRRTRHVPAASRRCSPPRRRPSPCAAGRR